MLAYAVAKHGQTLMWVLNFDPQKSSSTVKYLTMLLKYQINLRQDDRICAIEENGTTFFHINRRKIWEYISHHFNSLGLN